MSEMITAIYQHERHRWDNAVLLDCKLTTPEGAEQPVNTKGRSLSNALHDLGGITVKTSAEPDEMREHLTYKFFGKWTVHEKYGRQFVAQAFVLAQPHGKSGVLRYLDIVPGIGIASARKLWDAFDSQAVRILREQPDIAKGVLDNRFSMEKAEEAAKFLNQQKRLEDISIDMMDLLGGRGFPRDTAKMLIADYGEAAPAFVERNPYLLRSYPGCGFLGVDKMYLELGGKHDALKRQTLCTCFALDRDRDGHTWHPPEAITAAIQERVSGTNIRPVDAVRLGVRSNLLATRRDTDGRLWVADAQKAKNEHDIAEWCKNRLDPTIEHSSRYTWPSIRDLDVSSHQSEQLQEALRLSVGILDGSPGTGKTYVAAKLIGRLVAMYGEGIVACAAPTGKAAVRLAEVLAEHKVPVGATTIHRLLRVQQLTREDGWGFKYNRSDPLPWKFIFLDEISMMDADLMAAVMRACGHGTHLLMIGDPQQLPPIGHGAPLRDMLDAGIPCGKLREIRRNTGTVVRCCAAIREEQPWGTDGQLAPDRGQNLKLLRATNAEGATQQIIQSLAGIRQAKVADPVWDCQIIVAVNKGSMLSRKLLNRRLQQELNPQQGRKTGSPFRDNDKVICLKNSFVPIDPDAPLTHNRDAVEEKVFVANGEQGRVINAELYRTFVTLESPLRQVIVPRGVESGAGEDGLDTGCDFDLAYAISCHRSQGSEFPIVFVVLDEYPGARMVCSREWLYTAISRTQTAGFLVGKKETADSMCQRQAIRKRKTFLTELIVNSTPPFLT